MARRSKAQREAGRKRNLSALHCAMMRLAREAGMDVAAFKAAWLMERFGVASSTDLSDPQLWDALDIANGKIPFRRRSDDDGRRGDPERPMTDAQRRKIGALMARDWPRDQWGELLEALIRRQTRGRTCRLNDCNVREASAIIEAFEGHSVPSGLAEWGARYEP